MATLHNLTDIDVFYARLHQMVEARGSVEIPDDEADHVPGTGVWRVERAVPQRRQVTRGGKQVELDVAPEMETR